MENIEPKFHSTALSFDESLKPKRIYPSSKKPISRDSERYFIPGYKGFCPQIKYKYGQTFGRETAQLIKENNLSSSKNSMLNSESTNESSFFDSTTDSQQSFKKSPLKDKKYQPNLMKPGYAGFIPKSQQYFGKSYSINCNAALNKFFNEYEDQKTNLTKYSPALPSKRIENSLEKVKSDFFSIRPSKGIEDQPNCNLDVSFENTNNWTLRERSDRVVYQPNAGLIPNYGGHVPKLKYTHGKTFTASSFNSIGRPNGMI